MNARMLIVALGAVACGPVAEVGPMPTLPVASAPSVSASRSDAATAHADAKGDASTAEPPPVPDLHAVTRIEPQARLLAVDNALFVVEQTGPVGDPNDGRSGNRIGVVQGVNVVYPEELFLEGWFHQVVAMHGSYPNDLHMLAVGDTGRTGIAEHYVLDPKHGWKQKQSLTGSWFVGAARVGRSLVGLTAPVMWGSVEFVTLSGPRVKLRPSAFSVCPEDSEMRARGSKSRLIPASMVGTTGGELVAVGNDCLAAGALEIWTPGQSRSRILPLPEGSPEIDLSVADVSLARGSHGDVWLLSSPGLLYHYRDGAFSEVALPAADSCSLIRTTASDALWTLCAGQAYERVGTSWQARRAESDTTLDDLAVSADGTLWATGQGHLFRNAVAPGAPTLPTAATPTAATPTAATASTAPSAASGTLQSEPLPVPTRRRLPTPGGSRCAHNVVVLYAFTKTTPLDYDFPLTRQALRGHGEFATVRFVVTRDVGQRFFAALVPSYDLGKKLRALIETEVKGSKPQVVCAEPEVERDVVMDLSPP